MDATTHRTPPRVSDGHCGAWECGYAAQLNQEVFFLRLAAFRGCSQPAGHAATAGPSILGVLGIAVLCSDGTFAFAALAEEVLNGEAMRLKHIDDIAAQLLAGRIAFFDHRAVH